MRVEQVALPVLRWVNAKPRVAPVLDKVLRPYNPFSPALNVDPYPRYEALRAKGDMVFHRGLNTWVISSWDLCEEVLRSPVSVDRSDLLDAVAPWSKLTDEDRAVFSETLLLVDPPRHTRLRKLVSRAFTPRTVERIEPRIAEIADELIAKAAGEDRVDLFEAVFAPLPIYVIGELLGIPEQDWPRLKGWSDELAKAIDPIEAFRVADMARVMGELRAAVDEWIELRTADPGEDLLSKLLEAEGEEGRLSRSELLSMVALLMTAGHETTSGFLGNSVVALADRPELRRRLAADPAIVASAVEELLRFDSPVQNTDRMVVDDTVIGGQRVKAGQMVMLNVGAANRDPAQFDDPHVVDFERPNIRSLSFGHGIHHCLGAALARQEARTVLPRVCEAFADHRIERAGVEWKRSMTLRGPVRLPMVRRSR